MVTLELAIKSLKVMVMRNGKSILQDVHLAQVKKRAAGDGLHLLLELNDGHV